MARRNKGFLRNTRFKARQKRNYTRRAKREATRQIKEYTKQQEEKLLYFVSTSLCFLTSG